MGDRVFDNQNGFEYWPAPKVQPTALLGLFGLAALAAIASASVAVVNMRGWYAALTPPPLTPPDPTPIAGWGLLAIIYVLMAGAAWRVMRRLNSAARRPSAQSAAQSAVQSTAMSAWGWQLALGAAWPAAFFGFHAMPAALIIAAMLVAAIAATIRRFARLDRVAAILLVPNLAWAGFLIYLNAGFWWLNQ